ncbi:MAG: hypothetical protein JST84_05215 [Acidobacteria bacterium]|nr:hypothetical protein [Acidobacteriota bacterium]
MSDFHSPLLGKCTNTDCGKLIEAIPVAADMTVLPERCPACHSLINPITQSLDRFLPLAIGFPARVYATGEVGIVMAVEEQVLLDFAAGNWHWYHASSLTQFIPSDEAIYDAADRSILYDCLEDMPFLTKWALAELHTIHPDLDWEGAREKLEQAGLPLRL